MESWFGFRLRGARARAKRAQRSTMGKKFWLSRHPRNFGSDKIVRTYIRPSLHVAGVKFFILITPRVSAVSLFVETHTNKEQSRFFVFSETTA